LEKLTKTRYGTYTWAIHKIKTSVSEIIKSRESGDIQVEFPHRNLSKSAILVILLFDRGIGFRLTSREVFFREPWANDNISRAWECGRISKMVPM